MSTFKKGLIKSFSNRKDLNGLIEKRVKYTTEKYRPFDPALYLYNQLLNFGTDKKFTDEFIELVYTTLIAWNMNQRGARLSKFEKFKKSILDNKDRIDSLTKYRLESLDEKDLKEIYETTKKLFKDLQLVQDGKPKLVTFSKTLHYFVPDLTMPVDRAYTLRFYYGNYYVPKSLDKQFDIYWDIFKDTEEFTKYYDFKKVADSKWNRSIPKIIDNFIIDPTKKIGTKN